MALRSHQATLLLILLVLAALLASAIFWPSRDFKPIENIAPITKASISPSSPFDMPPSWQPVDLPDDWLLTDSQQSTRWYRIEFSAQTDEEVWAIYIPKLAHQANFWLNGIWLNRTGQTEPTLDRDHNTPWLMQFSSALLTPDKNELIIRLQASSPRQGLLSPFYIGPASALTVEHRWHYFWRVEWVVWCTFTMYFLAALLAALWLSKRSETVYGIFALMLFIWATHNLNLFINRPPVSARVWEAMTMATLGWTVVCILWFNFRFLNRRQPRIERFMAVYSIVGVGFFILPSTDWILTLGYGVWDAGLLILGGYAIVFLYREFHLRHSTDAWLMMLVGMPILLTGLHDILLVNGHWPRTDGLYIQYSIVPTGLLFSVFLIRRFIQSLRVAEAHAEILQQRLDEKEQQLRQQFAKVKNLELAQMLNEERARIMRDMHDGVGGQLVSIRSQLASTQPVKTNELQATIDQTLTDFRLVIDSLDPNIADLPTLIGQMRPRLQALVKSRDMSLDWQPGDIPDEISKVGPSQALQIMRIIQEAVTNAVKHSNGTKVKLSTWLEQFQTEEQESVVIEIKDNGLGLRSESSIGKGLANMRYRASLIGAKLNHVSDTDGTVLSLMLPVSAFGSLG